MRTLKAPLAASLLLGLLQLPGPAAGEQRPSSRVLYEIPFASGTVDPARDFEASDPSGRDLVLVQFERYGTPGIVERVAATGVDLVQPLAPVSYMVWADAEQTRALRDLAGVRWAGVMPPETRVSGDVGPDTKLLRVTIVGDRLPRGAEILRSRPRRFTAVDGLVLDVAGNHAVASELARLPQVYSIADGTRLPELRDELSDQLVAGNVDRKGNPRPGYRRWLERVKADGRGVIISHVDGGVDFNHPELADRVAACIDYSPLGGGLCSVNNTDDVIGHGTHTAGIIVGTGSTDLGDADGFRYGQGMAPRARLVVQNAISVQADDPFADGYRPVYRDAHDEGAIVSANSWGPSGEPKGYDEDTREFDTIPRDINSDKRGDQPMAFVLSIMNGSGGESTQGTPDEGKNLVRVGAGGNRPRITGAPGFDDLCTCTAHGPALDGRMLPDLVAPGQNVMSTRATNGVLCGLSGSTQETPPSPLHAPCTGTSMASPHVSGGYAVFVQWFRKNRGGTPSPALVKAAFVNGATDLSRRAGVDADGERLTPIPNNRQGWGRFNLGRTIRSWRQGAVSLDQSVVFGDSGQSRSLRVKPVRARKPLKATLVWTDAPGHGKGGELPAWVNDLDLIVRGGGATYRGNAFAKGWSVAGGRADRRNNVENVYLRRGGDRSYRVTVRAASIIGDALPNRRGVTDQDFALVITNARRVRR